MAPPRQRDRAEAGSGGPVAIPAISVIVPVYEDWDRLERCLEALSAQSIEARAFEVVVVDNQKQAQPRSAPLPANARLIHEPTPGSYAARNSGVRASSGRYLAFTDSDCVPDPDWLRNGLRALEANPGARIAGPVDIFREPGTSGYAYRYDLRTAFPQKDYVAAGVSVTANLLVSRELFDRVGPFAERLSGADFEWNLRAQAAGIPIILDESVRVSHPARRSWREILRKQRRAAGSLPSERGLLRYVGSRAIAPARRVARLRRRQVPLRDWPVVLAIGAAGDFAQALEITLVRLRLKRPNRK